MLPSVVAELAKGFDLRSGRLNVTVPSNTTAGKYTITREPELFMRMKTSLKPDIYMLISQSLVTLETGALTSRSTRQFRLSEDDACLLLMTLH